MYIKKIKCSITYVVEVSHYCLRSRHTHVHTHTHIQTCTRTYIHIDKIICTYIQVKANYMYVRIYV